MDDHWKVAALALAAAAVGQPELAVFTMLLSHHAGVAAAAFAVFAAAYCPAVLLGLVLGFAAAAFLLGDILTDVGFLRTEDAPDELLRVPLADRVSLVVRLLGHGSRWVAAVFFLMSAFFDGVLVRFQGDQPFFDDLVGAPPAYAAAPAPAEEPAPPPPAEEPPPPAEEPPPPAEEPPPPAEEPAAADYRDYINQMYGYSDCADVNAAPHLQSAVLDADNAEA